MWFVVHIANIFFLLGLGALFHRVLGASHGDHGLQSFFRKISRFTGFMLILLAVIFSLTLATQVVLSALNLII
jgi:uncharacterized membrane protein